MRQKMMQILCVVVFCTAALGCSMWETESETVDPGVMAKPTGGDRYTQDESVDLSTEPRIALVIANGAYQHVPHLPNAANDAELMANTLKSVGFKLIGGAPLLDANKYAMESAIREFGRAITGKAVGLFYYSGHGVQWHGQNYLVPVTADVTGERDVKYELVDAGFITEEMGTAGNRLNLVILDACRNNPFGSRSFKEAGVGLAAMKAAAGTVLAFATQPGSRALAGNGHYSPYTEALATTITQPGLGLFETLNAVGVAVEQNTGGQQQPWFNASPIKGEFYFAGSFDAVSDEALAPSPTIPPPSNSTFSLSDLTKQEKITRSRWDKWQVTMQADFDQAAAFQGNAIFRRTAWTRFLTAYSENNPYSTKDEQLRTAAAKQRSAIKDPPIITPPDIGAVLPVGGTTQQAVAAELPTGKIVVPTIPPVTLEPVSSVKIDATIVPKVEVGLPTTTTALPVSVVGQQAEQKPVQPTAAVTPVIAAPRVTTSPPVRQEADVKVPVTKTTSVTEEQADTVPNATVVAPDNSTVVAPKSEQNAPSGNNVSTTKTTQ